MYELGFQGGKGDKILYKVTKGSSKELDGSYGGFQPKPTVEVVIVSNETIR